MNVEIYCVVCYHKLYYALHPPTKQSCRCATRVCIDCAREVTACPTCREPSLQSTCVDQHYLAEVCRVERSAKCEGCDVRKSTRAMAMHQYSCNGYLKRALDESRREGRVTQHQYRASVEENGRLSQDLHHAVQTIEYLNALLSLKQRRERGEAPEQAPAADPLRG